MSKFLESLVCNNNSATELLLLRITLEVFCLLVQAIDFIFVFLLYRVNVKSQMIAIRTLATDRYRPLPTASYGSQEKDKEKEEEKDKEENKEKENASFTEEEMR